MTNPTPHGQVPKALRLAEQYDHGDPVAHGNAWKAAVCTELRRQHTRIAELEYELEAVGAGGVQALSAAPAAKKSALRTYPNPIVPLIKPVSEQEKMRALYLASSNLMAYLGRNGAIHSDGHAADAMMDCLNDLDGGGFDETLFAASPTPPAEQQAAPKAAPGEPDKLMRDCLALLESFDYEDDEDSQSKAFFNAHINADWFFHVKHSIERQLEAEAAPQQEAQEPTEVPYQKLTNEIDLILSDPDTALSIGAKRALLWMRTWVSVPLYTAPQPAPHLPERDASLPAERQGLFRKFVVGRVDGSDKPGGKHHGCTYFVLDVDHDPCARPALDAYAAACEPTHPTLAADLRTKWGVVPAPQPAPAPLSESEYKRGYRDGYERRDAEVRGALV